MIYLAPLQASLRIDLHWSLQLGTLLPPTVTLYGMTLPPFFFFFFKVLALSENNIFFLFIVILPIKCKLCDIKDFFVLFIVYS